MHKCSLFMAIGLAAAIALAGCASQDRPRDGGRERKMSARPSTTRIDGLVADVDSSLLVIAGTAGRTRVALSETTIIAKREAASLDDIAVGEWIEAKVEKTESSSSMKATSIRIVDDPMLLLAEQGGGPAGQGPQGDGQGGPPAMPQGGDRGAPPDGSMGGGPPMGGSNSGLTDRTPTCLGKVESVDGRTVTLSIMSPQRKSEVSVLVGADAEIAKVEKATIGELKPGVRVAVVAEKGKDAKQEARSVEIE